MPVYNGERYLRQAIQSVLDQTYGSVELIAVNDGSTDGSATVLDFFGDRLTVVHQSNRGVGRARNAGIEVSRGEFIAFLDQDDWWHPDKVERQVDCFSKDYRIGLVHTGTNYYDDTSGTNTGGSSPEAAKLTGRCYEQLLLDNLINNSSVMVRRSVLDVVGLVDTTVAGNSVQDYDLWLRIARRFPLGYVPERLTNWRLHPGQGYWKRRTMLTEELRLLERHLGGTPPKSLRPRLASLLQELGRVHLLVSESSKARHYFARSIQLRLSRRNALFYGMSYLPSAVVRGLWRAKSWLSDRKEAASTNRIPAWVDQVDESTVSVQRVAKAL
jgi:glycosyltransferase involved in cell wall biosynthesis